MAELKTKETDRSAVDFINTVADAERRQDCFALAELMQNATGAEPKMWGSSIVGFGRIHYVYSSGHEGDWPPVGFSPRKSDLTLYFMGGLEPQQALLKKLGKHKAGKGCVYIKRLSDIRMPVLRQMVERSVKLAAKTASHAKASAPKTAKGRGRKTSAG